MSVKVEAGDKTSMLSWSAANQLCREHIIYLVDNLSVCNTISANDFWRFYDRGCSSALTCLASRNAFFFWGGGRTLTSLTRRAATCGGHCVCAYELYIFTPTMYSASCHFRHFQKTKQILKKTVNEGILIRISQKKCYVVERTWWNFHLDSFVSRIVRNKNVGSRTRDEKSHNVFCIMHNVRFMSRLRVPRRHTSP